MRTLPVVAACCALAASSALLASRARLAPPPAPAPAVVADLAPLASPRTAGPTVRNVSPFGDGPARFEPNLGQSSAGVRWLRRGPRDLLLVCDDGFSVLAPSSIPRASEGAPPVPLEAVRMRFDGGAAAPRSAGEGALDTVTHYFVGPDPSKWLKGVPNYARVRLGDVWPGIDVVFHGRDGLAEYDFLLGPGADPGAIALAVEGASAVRVDERGDLVLEAGNVEFRHRRPVVWQTEDGVRRPVACAFELDDAGRVRFRVTGADARLPLVIDPIITARQRVGGDAVDFASVAVVTSEDVTLVGGTTFSALAGIGPLAGTRSGNSDAFVGAFAPGSATLTSLAILGGASNDGITDLQVARNDAVYGSGYTGDAGTLPRIGGETFSNLGGALDSFLFSVTDTVDVLNWIFPLGGAASDMVTSIALQHASPSNPMTTAIVAGMHTNSIVLDGFDPFPSTGQKAVLYRFDASGLRTGQRLISNFSGVFQQVPILLAADETNGSLYVGATGFGSAFTATPGAAVTTTPAVIRGCVQKFAIDLSALEAATFVPASVESPLNGMAYVPGVGVAMTGFYSSGNVTTTANAAFPGGASATGLRSHFTTINTDLSAVLTQTNVHETGTTIATSVIAVPGSEDVVLVGTSNGLTNVGGGASFHGTPGSGPADVVYIRLQAAGGLPTQVGYVGGTGTETVFTGFPSGYNQEYGRFGTVGNDGELVLVGQTLGTFADWPELTGGGSSGTRDVFIDTVPLGNVTGTATVFDLESKKFALTLGRTPAQDVKVTFQVTLLDTGDAFDSLLGGAGTFDFSMTAPFNATRTSTLVDFSTPLGAGRLTNGGLVEVLKGKDESGQKWNVTIDARPEDTVIIKAVFSGLTGFERPYASPIVGSPAFFRFAIDGLEAETCLFAPPTNGRTLKFDEPRNEVAGGLEVNPQFLFLSQQNSASAILENPLDEDRFVSVEIFHENFRVFQWDGTVESRSFLTGIPGTTTVGTKVATPETGLQLWYLRLDGSLTDSTRTRTLKPGNPLILPVTNVVGEVEESRFFKLKPGNLTFNSNRLLALTNAVGAWDQVGSLAGTAVNGTKSGPKRLDRSLFPCGNGPNGFTVCPVLDAPDPGGEQLVIAVQYAADIPLADPSNLSQYGFVFDQDGDASNNYRPIPQFAGDYYQDTDKWYSVEYSPAQGWRLVVTDARNGSFVQVASAARAVISGRVMMLVVPASEFAVARPAYRTTAFRHRGDFGQNPPHDWNADYDPQPGKPLRKFP